MSLLIDFRGIDLIRSRDCVVFVKGEAHMVALDQTIMDGGWIGGQGVQWVNAMVDDPTVSYSSGLFGGFLLWGSDESADRFTAMTGNQIAYGHAVMMAGRALISTRAYESYTYASRSGPGPLVPLIYKAHDRVFFSLRGLWTNEDELTLSSNPLAPAFFTGVVSQVPKAINEFYLGIQTKL